VRANGRRRKSENCRQSKRFQRTSCWRACRTNPTFAPNALDRRYRLGGVSADNRHQHGHLLRPTIFKFAGITAAGPAILAGAALTMVIWFFHVLAIFLMDRVAGRPLLLAGVAGQSLGLAILGAAFQFTGLVAFKSEVAIGGLVIYVACFAFNLGPSFCLMISGIYPLKVRGAAMSVATVANWSLNLIVAVTFLTLVDVLGRPGTFWLYGIIAAPF
jgi:hypothetical protein